MHSNWMTMLNLDRIQKEVTVNTVR